MLIYNINKLKRSTNLEVYSNPKLEQAFLSNLNFLFLKKKVTNVDQVTEFKPKS